MRKAFFVIFALLIFSVIPPYLDARPSYYYRRYRPGGYGYHRYGYYYGLKNPDKMPPDLNDEDVPRDNGIFEKLNLLQDAKEARENIPDVN